VNRDHSSLAHYLAREGAAMSKATKHSIFPRIAAGLVMGSLTLALIGSTATIVPVQSAELGPPVGQLILPVAAIATVLIVAFSTTARAAWGRLCLTNGVVSLALAIASLKGRGQLLGATDPIYERALDQAMQSWLGRLMWTAAAYSCAALVVAAVFFVLSYWLLHSPYQRHGAAQ
jgi:hypothetical protein